MWISKKRWNEVEKRLADLEWEIKSQPITASVYSKVFDEINNNINVMQNNILNDIHLIRDAIKSEVIQEITLANTGSNKTPTE